MKSRAQPSLPTRKYGNNGTEGRLARSKIQTAMRQASRKPVLVAGGHKDSSHRQQDPGETRLTAQTVSGVFCCLYSPRR